MIWIVVGCSREKIDPGRGNAEDGQKIKE